MIPESKKKLLLIIIIITPIYWMKSRYLIYKIINITF